MENKNIFIKQEPSMATVSDNNLSILTYHTPVQKGSIHKKRNFKVDDILTDSLSINNKLSSIQQNLFQLDDIFPTKQINVNDEYSIYSFDSTNNKSASQKSSTNNEQTTISNQIPYHHNTSNYDIK